jgi:hypothetical protein
MIARLTREELEIDTVEIQWKVSVDTTGLHIHNKRKISDLFGTLYQQ